MLEEAEQTQSVKKKLVRTLGEMGSEAKVAVPKLLELLKDTDKETCGGAAVALARIGGEPQKVFEVLMDFLDDSDASGASVAIYGFYNLGPLAKDAVPTLIKRLHGDDKQDVRNAILPALYRPRSQSGNPGPQSLAK